MYDCIQATIMLPQTIKSIRFYFSPIWKKKKENCLSTNSLYKSALWIFVSVLLMYANTYLRFQRDNNTGWGWVTHFEVIWLGITKWNEYTSYKCWRMARGRGMIQLYILCYISLPESPSFKVSWKKKIQTRGKENRWPIPLVILDWIYVAVQSS